VRSPTACENPTPGQPTAVLTCDVKPDGNVCFHLRVEPAPAAGDLLLVGLRKSDGTPLPGQAFDIAVGAGAPGVRHERALSGW